MNQHELELLRMNHQEAIANGNRYTNSAIAFLASTVLINIYHLETANRLLISYSLSLTMLYGLGLLLRYAWFHNSKISTDNFLNWTCGLSTITTLAVVWQVKFVGAII